MHAAETAAPLALVLRFVRRLLQRSFIQLQLNACTVKQRNPSKVHHRPIRQRLTSAARFLLLFVLLRQLSTNNGRIFTCTTVSIHFSPLPLVLRRVLRLLERLLESRQVGAAAAQLLLGTGVGLQRRGERQCKREQNANNGKNGGVVIKCWASARPRLSCSLARASACGGGVGPRATIRMQA